MKPIDSDFGNTLTKRLQEEFPDCDTYVELDAPKCYGHLLTLVDRSTKARAQMILSYQDLTQFLPEAELLYLGIIINRFKKEFKYQTPA